MMTSRGVRWFTESLFGSLAVTPVHSNARGEGEGRGKVREGKNWVSLGRYDVSIMTTNIKQLPYYHILNDCYDTHDRDAQLLNRAKIVHDYT